MTITDGLHYIAVGNPLSKTIIGTTTALLGKSSDKIKVNKFNFQISPSNYIEYIPYS